uniref:Uncharacterized protein n=1 Tax=Arundo donax TaxID=35708 RepID=A0A0A9H3V6_ARUDO
MYRFEWQILSCAF